MNSIPKSQDNAAAVHHVAVSELSDGPAHGTADAVRPDRRDVDRHSRRVGPRLPHVPLPAHRRVAAADVIMMNNGISDGANYNVAYAWPSDLIAMERNVPPGAGHQKWREIEGKKYYMPGEVCDPIGKDWFWVAGDKPRSDEALLKQFHACRAGGVNLLLDVPPDKHGLIPDETVAALMRLRKNAEI